MRVISPFGSSIESIADLGCHAIASRTASMLFSAKIAKAVQRVSSAESRLSKLQTEQQLMELRLGFEEVSDRELEDLKSRVELAEYMLNEAMVQHDAVLDAKDRCYWYVYAGECPYR